jgi:Domain of unknown function (DUF4153)
MAPVSLAHPRPRGTYTDHFSEQQTGFTTRAVASIMKFLLVPLLLVYTAILYAYAIKIGLEGTLPKGTLGC